MVVMAVVLVLITSLELIPEVVGVVVACVI